MTSENLVLKAAKAVIFPYGQSIETVNCCQTCSLALLSFLNIDVEAQSRKLMLFNIQSQVAFPFPHSNTE